MSLADVVNLTISRESRTPTRPGFGVPLIAASKVPGTWGPNPVRQFGSLKEMTDAGFALTDPAYLQAQAMKSQSPSIARWKVGKRTLPPTARLTLTVSPTIAQGNIILFSLGNADISYTVPVTPTPTTVATALAALITAPSGWTAAAAAGVITLTAAAVGNLPTFKNWSTSYLAVADTTTDPGIATDLQSFLTDKDWYGLLIDSNSKAEVVATATWTEANKKLFGYVTADSAAADPAQTTDVMSALKTLTFFRTFGSFVNDDVRSVQAAAWMGDRFPYDPGLGPDAGGTWAYKALEGTNIQTMTDGVISAVLAKNGNVYTEIAGLGVTQYGKTAGGEWIDVIRFLDWLESDIKLRVFTLFANKGKVPYTNAGRDMIVNEIKGSLAQGVSAGGLADSPAPDVIAPDVLQQSALDRGARSFPGIQFTCRLAGAIHTISVNGSVSV